VRARPDEVTADDLVRLDRWDAGSLDRPMMPKVVGVLDRFHHGAAGIILKNRIA
jgi:hypothetical protein